MEIQDKQELKNLKRKKSAKRPAKDPNSEKQAKELKKTEIEAKEHSIDKNKKIKRVSVDENLSETVHQWNIH